mgnify:CR=1 FL=1
MTKIFSHPYSPAHQAKFKDALKSKRFADAAAILEQIPRPLVTIEESPAAMGERLREEATRLGTLYEGYLALAREMIATGNPQSEEMKSYRQLGTPAEITLKLEQLGEYAGLGEFKELERTLGDYRGLGTVKEIREQLEDLEEKTAALESLNASGLLTHLRGLQS